jgi:hypothetical protein
MPEPYQVQITMTSGQARLIRDALELFVALGIGRTEEVSDMLGQLHKLEQNQEDTLKEFMKFIKINYLGCPPKGNWGISNPEKVDPVARTAYDLKKVFEKVIAVAENHDMSVWHDGDMLHYGTEPTPEAAFVRDGIPTPVEVMRHRR